MIIILIILFIVILYYNYKIYPNDNMIYERATFDNNLYLVRNLNDKSKSANMIAKCKKNIIMLIEFLNTNIKNFPKYKNNIKNNILKIKTIVIMETSADKNNYETTSYTINKKTVIFCIRSKIMDNIHDINTLMYVLIHELAHILNPLVGHGAEFYEIFKFLLQQSIIINIYNPINYTNFPVNYCGMKIEEYLL